LGRYAEIDSSGAIVVGRGLEAVYIIYYSALPNRKKIGMVVDQSLGARLSQFVQTGAPSTLAVELIILTDNARSVEEAIHARLSSYRVRGEWYDIPSLWEIIDLREFGKYSYDCGPQADIFEHEQKLRALMRQYKQLLEMETHIHLRIRALGDYFGILQDEYKTNEIFYNELRRRIEELFWKENNINETKMLLRGWETKISEQEQEINGLKRRLAIKEAEIKEHEEKAARMSQRWRINRPFGT